MHQHWLSYLRRRHLRQHMKMQLGLTSNFQEYNKLTFYNNHMRLNLNENKQNVLNDETLISITCYRISIINNAV